MVPSRFLAGLVAPFAASASLVTASQLVPGAPSKVNATQPLGGPDSALLKHPADWSRDVLPIPVHSHNDYWRDVPILHALSLGVRSVESDVWLHENELYVGHDPFSLSRHRTFQSLTVEPLLKALDQANEANGHRFGSRSDTSSFWSGLQQQLGYGSTNIGFYSAGVGLTAPIQLLIDIKTDGATTWPRVVDELEPLRKAGYLTRFEDGKLIPGQVLVIGTGNTPVEQVAPKRSRDYFFDGPLGNLTDDGVMAGSHRYEWNSTLAPIASVDFNKVVTWNGITEASDEVRANLTKTIKEAHAKKIETRFWDTPGWPAFARDRVNTLLLELGSDWINADDLEDIAKRW